VGGLRGKAERSLPVVDLGAADFGERSAHYGDAVA
jgi:hypothetical protein